MRRIIGSSLSILLIGGAGSAFANGPIGFPSALPPVSNPGECYAQVKVPAQYQSGTETVVKADGYSKLEVTQPQFQSRREGVMVKEPSVRYVVRQPSYRTVNEQILTRPAHERLSVSQPQFSTVTETLQTSAPHLVWKRGNPGELQRQGYVIHSTADGRLRGAPGERRLSRRRLRHHATRRRHLRSFMRNLVPRRRTRNLGLHNAPRHERARPSFPYACPRTIYNDQQTGRVGPGRRTGSSG